MKKLKKPVAKKVVKKPIKANKKPIKQLKVIKEKIKVTAKVKKPVRKYTKRINKNTQLNASMPLPKPHPWTIGEKYLIRTVTMYFTGRLSGVYDQELVFDECSWIPDTGRFNNALVKGELSEVEPIPTAAIVGRGALIDASIWQHDLPKEVK